MSIVLLHIAGRTQKHPLGYLIHKKCEDLIYTFRFVQPEHLRILFNCIANLNVICDW